MRQNTKPLRYHIKAVYKSEESLLIPKYKGIIWLIKRSKNNINLRDLVHLRPTMSQIALYLMWIKTILPRRTIQSTKENIRDPKWPSIQFASFRTWRNDSMTSLLPEAPFFIWRDVYPGAEEGARFFPSLGTEAEIAIGYCVECPRMWELIACSFPINNHTRDIHNMTLTNCLLPHRILLQWEADIITIRGLTACQRHNTIQGKISISYFLEIKSNHIIKPYCLSLFISWPINLKE